MGNPKVLGALLVVVLTSGLLYRVAWPLLSSRSTTAPLLLDDEPVQEFLDPPEQVVVERGGHRFTIARLARYDISGEVLASTSSALASHGDLAEVVVGLIWGPRREAYKQRFTFDQAGSALIWRTTEEVSPEDMAELGRHISNNHLIPAEGHPQLMRGMRWLSKGDRVRIRGALVRVVAESGEVLTTSSTSREDTGDGACEVIWVEELQVNGRAF